MTEVPTRMIRLCIAFFLFSILLQLSACTGKGKNIPDVSSIPVEVEIERFDIELFSLDTNNLKAELAILETDYPEFSNIFFEHIIGANDPSFSEDQRVDYIKGFITDERVRALYDTTLIVFSDLSPVRDQFARAFQFYQYYFPGKPIPRVTTFLSEYTYGTLIYGNDKLATGLDFFLGNDYPYGRYNPGNANFSNYLTRTFNTDHLVSKTLHVLVEDLVGPPAGNRMLDIMVHNGKKQYILKQLMPYAADSVLFEHSGKQMQWLEENELEMWAFFLEKELLYSTRPKDFRKYVERSPDSPEMPPEAPGNTATYMGYQIVSAYMERYPNETLPNLIMIRDGQQLLSASKYKPKR